MNNEELLKKHNKMIFEMIENGSIKGDLADAIKEQNAEKNVIIPKDNDISKASAEILEILKYFPENELNKIPKKFIENLEKNADKNYIVSLDPNKSLLEQNLREKTTDIIAILCRNYLCTEEEKNVLDKMLNKNEKKKFT